MSKEYIRWKEFVQHAPSECGDTVRIREHSGCTGSSKALMICRRDDGDIDCYCHRCGLSGFYSTSGKKTPAQIKNAVACRRGKTASRCDSAPVYLPRDFTIDGNEWSSEATSWIRAAGLTAHEVRAHRIGYSKFFNRVIIPCYSKGDLVGYQTRQLIDDGYPKYWTKRKGDMHLYKFITNAASPVLFIVEDVLSAIKLSRYYNSLALLGTNLCDDMMHGFLQFDHVIIYMDNDNPRVKKLQSVINARLEFIVDKVTLLKRQRDPKLLSDSELQSLV